MMMVFKGQTSLTIGLKMTMVVSVWILLALDKVEGHGRLIDPPGRSSMWRFGFHTPINYDDNALYCGGFDRQWNRNRGRCGICGDAFDGPRDNEAGGLYARGVIAKTYRGGQTIRVTVQLTRSHKGWFEFRLCPNNNTGRRATQRCLDSNLLKLTDGSTRYQVTSWASTNYQVDLKLPQGLTCSQCVLQWKYNAGNSWGCYGKNTHCCVGCGPQEQFYGCADVAITRSTSSSYSNVYNQGRYNNEINNNNNNNNNRFGLFQLATRAPGVFGRVQNNGKR